MVELESRGYVACCAKLPHLIVILPDDLGYGNLSCHGSQYNRTPNIDALAKGGVRLTDFHSNGAVCSPARAALTTGSMA